MQATRMASDDSSSLAAAVGRESASTDPWHPQNPNRDKTVLAYLKRWMISADRFLAATQKGALVVLSLIVSTFMVIEVMARYVFGEPLFGLEEVTLMSVMWLYMIGASTACRERSHLKAEMVHLFIKDEKLLKYIEVLATFIALVMAVFIVSWSYDLTVWGLQKRQSTPVFGIPWVVSQSSLLFASILFVVYLLRDLVQDIGKALETARPSGSKGSDARGSH